MSKIFISGWGNNKTVLSNVITPKSIIEIKNLIKNKKKLITRGLGRSYGDSSIQANCVVELKNFDKIISFNKKDGIVKAQAGISLKCLLEKIIANGWFVPVSPGTKYVTLGGMVASNVHGKNQHLDGCLINHILSIKLLHKDKIIKITKSNNSDLFYTTCGGMGLTGTIIEVEIKLYRVTSSKINQNSYFFDDLKSLIYKIRQCKDSYSVAWIDVFSLKQKKINSILYTGNHSSLKENLSIFKFKREKKIISWIVLILQNILNSFSIKIFNTLKFYSEKLILKKNISCGINTFFYPLDHIINWNEFYGKKGFAQYQFVLPYKNCEKKIIQILSILIKTGHTPYLAVLKNMKKDKGVISFSKNGISLALDIPESYLLKKIIQRLDKIILHANGKIYLAKDSYLDKKTFQKMYSGYKKLKLIRKKYNLVNFQSLQSKRLGI
jgi:decaprenylphospho-beta-D-ribofuranose 2-oxidase